MFILNTASKSYLVQVDWTVGGNQNTWRKPTDTGGENADSSQKSQD